MTLEYGVIETSDLSLPLTELLTSVERALAEYSYDRDHPPDFRGLFLFVVSNFADTEDIDIAKRVCEVLGNIAGYRLGAAVADVFPRAAPILKLLLGSSIVAYLKIAVDFFRKVSRVVGPRIVIERFIAPNAVERSIQRGLAIVLHQIIIDCPKFPFVEKDFGEWTEELVGIVGLGEHLASTIRERIPSANFGSGRPSSVREASSTSQEPFIAPNYGKSHRAPNSANNAPRHRLPLARKNQSWTATNSSVYKMTSRQQQVREFIDEPFGESESVSGFTEQMRKGIQDSDWEQRSASYNLAKRLLRYSPENVSDEDVHNIVTAVIDDISTPRAALALSSIGALSEAFLKKSVAMEFELPRLIPVLVKLHQKTAQFFEAALSQCMEDAINSTPPRRFLSVIVASGNTRSSKVQASIAKYIRQSLQRLEKVDKRISKQQQNELTDLIQLIFSYMSGAASETREEAKESARLLSQLYGDAFQQIVSKTLDPRDCQKLLNPL